MKKYQFSFLLLLFLFAGSQRINAQEESDDLMFGGGKQHVSLGYDLYALRSLLRTNTSGFGPMLLKYEYGITRRIGLGVNLGFGNDLTTGSFQDSVTNGGITSAVIINTTQRLQTFSSLIRANYHFDLAHFTNPFFDDLDLYAGLGMGYGFTNAIRQTNSINDPDENNFDSFFNVELSIGARYYIEDFIGVYAEYGRSISALQIGLTVKF